MKNPLSELSHHFQQGLVTVPMLRNSPSARADFLRLVRERTDGPRVLPDDPVPRRPVFAIHPKRGTAPTSDTLFAVSRATPAHTVRTLEQRGIQDQPAA
ncbi:DUF6119 family protein [Streptomyces sp. B6B3]|uniref:DUF6119 family protein n=1 Tax=Streptomyces sp. B6B3 TaxID=3153570 RepID=UPI00325D864B